MTLKVICVLSLLFVLTGTAFFNNNVFRSSRNSQVASNSFPRKSSIVSSNVVILMSTSEAATKDFSQYVVGQEYDATLLSSKPFGLFAGLPTGTNVLLPRSVLTKTQYEKLKRMVDVKSKDTVKVQLISVSEQNKTLSARYLSGTQDISALSDKDVGSKTFPATVVGVHDFGIFVELPDFGVEGLVPSSKVPKKADMKSAYPVGTSVVVKVDSYNAETNKLTLNMKMETNSVAGFLNIAPEKWIQAVVTGVTKIGLFVRPAGSDSTGLVHISKIPRDLIYVLKKAVPPASVTANMTDVELLFQEGDVIKVRVQSVNVDSGRADLSMLPFRASDGDDEDDYVVEGRDPEGEEDKFNFYDQDDAAASYDAQSTLLWWKGSPFKKIDLEADGVDEDEKVLDESAYSVIGKERRLFEIDLRADEADFTSKIAEAELKELEEEIGELSGLDDDLVDPLGFGTSFNSNRFGSFVSSASLPASWKTEMDFFKELDNYETTKTSGLKGGKGSEQQEFEKLIREVEMELEQASARVSRKKEEDVVVAQVEEAAPEAPGPTAAE